LMKTFQEGVAAIKAEAPNSKIYAIFDAVKTTLNGRPLILYGAGMLGSKFLSVCQECGIAVARFCDREATGVLEGIEIISPDLLRAKYSDAVVISSSMTYNNEICNTLKDLGFSPEQIIPCPCEYPYFFTMHGFETHIDGYQWAYNFFEDDRSKQLVLDRMRMYLLNQAMQVNTNCDRYYEDDFISLSNNEIFVDGGAYDGDTANFFIKKMREIAKTYLRVYAFEPHPLTHALAMQRLSQLESVEIVQKGLWSVERELPFFDGYKNIGASFVLGSGNRQYVQVTSIDAFFKNKPLDAWPSFIKMDIEGAEREALLGSAEVIKKRKPKLAICAYHKPEDIYELPQTILGIRDDYRFALRQHRAGCYDTILYAV